MGAYRDQCAPANPRMPMLADMKDLMVAAYYGISIEDARLRMTAMLRHRRACASSVLMHEPR